ncbi:MiAMP1 family antimicrobial peptide [Streptomyces sp. NPDC059152]|uniref:MiAMP1 family antimicrobial peptide n=1 Tax=Streptomyces sp. NPDC059152 TaxID=3346742 RepID=UPI0036777BFD
MAAATVAALGLSTGAAFASTFVAYEGPYFTGRQQVITACWGPQRINFHGSYKWYGTGQTGDMSNVFGGPTVFALPSNHNSEQGTGFGWQSISIIC